MEKQTAKSVYILLFLAAVLLIASGWVDLDWMFVQAKFQQGQGSMTVLTWEFCPYATVNWWVAYQLCIARLFVGWLLIGFLLSKYRA